MQKKLRLVLELGVLAGFIGLALTAAFALGYWTCVVTANDGLVWMPGQTPDYALLGQVRRLLEKHYIGALPDSRQLEYGAIRGYVQAVGDPYTVFVDPQPHELETQALQGEYGGAGMSLIRNDQGEIVLSPFANSPAAKAGILEGDLLLAVDGRIITPTMSMNEVVTLVRGPVNTGVLLKVRHLSGVELTATIIRQAFPIPSVNGKILSDYPQIGLISINLFSSKTPAEVKRTADELTDRGAQMLILDLRNNGGGILEAGIDTAALFLDGGVIMYETQKDLPEKVFSAPANSSGLNAMPLAVLVNGNTASAAEIVAGALLDRDRAALIGQKTYGKGSVQLVFDLVDGTSLHVTAHLWYTPQHRALQGNGLPPTLAVVPATDGRDIELQEAIKYLLSKQ